VWIDAFAKTSCLDFALSLKSLIIWLDIERTAMQKLKEQLRGKDLAFYAANLPPDATFEVSVQVVGDDATLTPEQIAGVEEARRSLEFASKQEIDAVYAKHGA
jgi:hypothetical protein